MCLDNRIHCRKTKINLNPDNMENLELHWTTVEDKLRSFIIGKVQDRMLADDILQEVFIKIHSKIDTLKDSTKIQPWIYQIARNLIIDHQRKSGKINSRKSDLKDVHQDEYSNELLDEALEDMVKMMDDLKPEYCEALCLTELEGMSVKEYALKAGISYPSAKSRVHRGRQLLKDLMMNCCHYEFDKYGEVLDITPNKCCCCCCEGN